MKITPEQMQELYEAAVHEEVNDEAEAYGINTSAYRMDIVMLLAMHGGIGRTIRAVQVKRSTLNIAFNGDMVSASRAGNCAREVERG